MRFIFLLVTILVLSLINVAGSTVNFDNDNPAVGQSVVAIMVLDSPQERNQAYTLTWRDQNGAIIQTDLGTTPSSTGVNFFESYTVTSGIINGTATLTGTNLEGSDTFVVTESNSTLIINNTLISYPLLVGKNVGINYDVFDSDGNAISGAECYSCQTLGNEVPVGACSEFKKTVGGHGDTTGLISFNSFQEDREYLATIHCIYDSVGDGLFDKNGVQSFEIDVLKWLEVNTIIDDDEYYGTQEIEICANVTNLVYDRRINLNIFHQIRCSAYEDNNNDTDRNLIVSDDNKPDKRGIDVNTTQNQCKRFVLPEPKYLQGKTSSCYASTEVQALDENGDILVGYLTTSDMFNFTIDNLNLDADWEYLDNGKLSTRINLSSEDDDYNEYSSNITNGSIDIRLYKDGKSIRHEDQFLEEKIDIENIIKGKRIKNIEAQYCDGTNIPNVGLEYLNDGNLEIELRNVDLTENGCYYVTFDIMGDGKMYLTIGIIFIAVILLLYFFSDKLEFEKTFKDKDGKEETKVISTFKYMVWFICLWLLLGLINIALKINEVGALGLSNTLGTLYTASVYIAYIFSAVFIFYLIYKSLNYLGGKFADD